MWGGVCGGSGDGSGDEMCVGGVGMRCVWGEWG